MQIASRVTLRNNLVLLRSMATERVRKSSFPHKTNTRNEPVEPLGKPRAVSETAKQFVLSCIGDAGSLLEHHRVSFNGHVFHSCDYLMPTKTDTAVMKIESDYVRENKIVVAGSGGTTKANVLSDIFHVLSNASGVDRMKLVQREATWRLYELDGSAIPCMVLVVRDSIIFVDLCTSGHNLSLKE